MKFLNKILDIVKDDRWHNIKIEIDNTGIIVFLDDDPELNGFEKFMIPVKYDVFQEGCVIPHGVYMKYMEECPEETGIDKEEIEIILKIMACSKNMPKKSNHFVINVSGKIEKQVQI